MELACNAVALDRSNAAQAKAAKKALVLGAVLALLQALDGLLTSVGVSRFGVAVEGNPFIRALMQQFGHITALSVIKTLAVLVIVALVILSRRMPWVNHALGAISCLYLFSAIIPWTYFLFIQPYFM